MAELRLNFPFSAIVDQERLKLALLLNAINPSVGGLLVRGPKGSGKSVGVRALEDLLPEVEVVADCPFKCSPRDPSNMCSSCRPRWESGKNLPVKKMRMRVITLPLGSTEDRVVGTLDMEKALREGVKAFQPGILAEANQNILYVDEINLLPDHIVDDLLDAAASGWNVVDRESISVAHPSRFLLVGTMNPEEGELRPQLLDRLPISVTLHTIHDVDERVEIVKRNLEFKRHPSAFIKKYSSEQEKMRQNVLKAKELLEKTRVPDSVIYLASSICANLEVDGQRPDIIIAETAKTIAALNGRSNIAPQDVLEAAKLALNHRTRKGGFEGPPNENEIEEAYRKAMHIYRRVEDTTPRKEPTRESSQFSSQYEQFSSAKSVGDSPKLETKPEVEGDIKGLKKEGKYIKVSAPSPSLLILLGLVPIVLLLGLGIYFQVNLLYLWLFFLFLLTTYVVLLLLMRKKIPTTYIALRFVKISFSKVKGFFNRKSELLKGVPLGGKLKTWIDSKFRMLPDIYYKTSKRSFLAGKRATSLTTLTRGRYRYYEKPKKPTGDIALFPTIQAAAINRHVNREETPLLSVQPDDVRTKIRVYKAPVTVVLVLDVSGSMASCLDSLAEAAKILNREAYRKRDRLGLIAFKGGSAYVLNDPTTNINVVAGKIKRLKVSYFQSTPLADGMMKALEVVKKERRRNRGVIPLVVLISDFLPNIPLKMPGHMVDPTADTLYVAKLLRRNRVPVIAISTDAWKGEVHNDIYWGGYPLAREIAKITGGRYYEFSPSLTSSKKLEKIILESFYDTNFLITSSISPTSPFRMQSL